MGTCLLFKPDRIPSFRGYCEVHKTTLYQIRLDSKSRMLLRRTHYYYLHIRNIVEKNSFNNFN